MSKPILEIKNVSKDFSGVYALKNIDMQIFPGMVTAVIGENGAGKSTLMKIISGVYTTSEGQVLLNGEVVAFKNPKEAAEKGVVIIHQELSLIPHLSITENLFLGQELTNSLGLLDYPRMHKKSRELLGLLKLDVDPKTPVNLLRVGQQQLVEIARALLFDSKVLIMDEPTSAISDSEVELLFSIIRDLTAKGVAILYISHKLKELFEIASRFEVLRDGEKVGTGIMQETDHDKLIGMMVGRELSGSLRDAGVHSGEEVLRVENLSFQHPEKKSDYLVNNVSFTLHKGEVLGIAGLMGAGRTELLEALFGLHPKLISGEVYIENKKVRIKNVGDAINAGLALVPEDRKLQGLILNMDVSKNTSLANLDSVSKYGIINKKKENQLSIEFINKLNTKVPTPRIEVQKLSGGNQQKVVIAKWLATNPKILLLDEPTRGIDVGAKAEIYKLINELAEQGMGIIVVSSELPEILAISDNILVLSESKLTGQFTHSEASEEKLMQAALVEKE
ncbi:sugar ABC transporter ATP-binding protein [uncultured Draconibacterium sp.]|uniref:sugar ABC transporter ATP-binding protein n=1 Tax=uncultured Draconibacterium sp. TaxID=1573823 RepID=UPI002AA91833|nr:sugar ABC transporter ATP-binding protein [uncultured Draconibacterium sp.]